MHMRTSHVSRHHTSTQLEFEWYTIINTSLHITITWAWTWTWTYTRTANTSARETHQHSNTSIHQTWTHHNIQATKTHVHMNEWTYMSTCYTVQGTHHDPVACIRTVLSMSWCDVTGVCVVCVFTFFLRSPDCTDLFAYIHSKNFEIDATANFPSWHNNTIPITFTQQI